MNTDNQQEIGAVANFDWLAGIMDGEGCIALLLFNSGKTHGAGHGFRIQMRATIGNTNDGVVERIVSILTAAGIGHHVQSQKSITKGRETGKVCRLIHVSSKANLLKFLHILHPRLADTDKKERAGLIIQLIEQREAFAREQGIRATHSYTQEDVDLILKFLRLTRSKKTERLAAILNDYTREARQTVTKKSRARQDIVWSPARVGEVAEMPTRRAA